MKKIGILFGQENSFPQAFVDCINQRLKKIYRQNLCALIK